MTPKIHLIERISAVILSLAIVAIGIASLMRTPIENATFAQLGNGAWQQSYESSFEGNLPLSDELKAGYHAIQILLFGQTQTEVVIGREGWLFSETEFKVTETFDRDLRKNIATISKLSAAIEAQDIPVLVVVLPDKARVMSDKLTSGRPTIIENRYQLVLDELRQDGRVVLDGYQILSDPALRPAFLRTDTHWTPEAAQSVASAALQRVALDNGNVENLLRMERREHVGDLYRLLALGPLQQLMGFESETVTNYELQAAAPASLNDLFGETEPAIHLVGTSYSADSAWTFADALETFSGRPVLNFAQSGFGPLKPMQDYLPELNELPELPALVIWEIPEKYLSLDPSEMSEIENG